MGLFNFKSTKSEPKEVFPWIPLDSLEQLDSIIEESSKKPILLFKHSTRCSISAMALTRFQNQFDKETNVDLYFLDLLKHRDVSNKIATVLGVQHQSPQAIVIYNNEVLYEGSHSEINANKIAKSIKDNL